MGLMATSNAADGDFTVYVKYNAKAGRWYTKADEQGAEEYEVSNLTAVFDFANVKTGWFLFAAGVAPSKTFDPSLTEAAPKPGEGFKRGFELRIFSDKNLGGVREFSSTANAVIEAINPIFDAYTAAPEAAQGKLPVVKCVKVLPVVGKHGTNYQPVFEIVQWVDRPPELAGANDNPSPPAAKSGGHVPPPAAKQPETVGVGPQDDVDF
jgi:hypothetical protein